MNGMQDAFDRIDRRKLAPIRDLSEQREGRRVCVCEGRRGPISGCELQALGWPAHSFFTRKQKKKTTVLFYLTLWFSVCTKLTNERRTEKGRRFDYDKSGMKQPGNVEEAHATTATLRQVPNFPSTQVMI